MPLDIAHAGTYNRQCASTIRITILHCRQSFRVIDYLEEPGLRWGRTGAKFNLTALASRVPEPIKYPRGYIVDRSLKRLTSEPRSGGALESHLQVWSYVARS